MDKEMESPNASDQGTPSYCKWAQNLHNLLLDRDGIELFKQYLMQEDHGTQSLDFWIICEGLKKVDNDKLHSAIKVVYRKYIRESPDISTETKVEILEKIKSNVALDRTFFDKAKEEVETVMTKTTYPNFLRSDVYIQFMQSRTSHSPTNEKCANWIQKTEEECELTNRMRDLEDLARSRDSLDLLQTVYEDSELQLSNMNNNNNSIHIVDISYNNNISGYSDRTVRKMFSKLNKLSNTAGKVKPEAQAGHYLKYSTPGYNTCYTKYAPFVPPSARDSELQSLSSDVQTDDTMSMISTSTKRSRRLKTEADNGISSDSDYYSTCRQSRAKKEIKTKPAIPFNNKDELPNTFLHIPRTQKTLPEAIPACSEQFVSTLMEKLNKVLEERRREESLGELMNSKFDSQPECHLPPQAIGAEPPMFDCPQDILDNHMLRVFEASPSPGCLTPAAAVAAPPVEFTYVRKSTTTTATALKSRKSSGHNSWRHPASMERQSPPYLPASTTGPSTVTENHFFSNRKANRKSYPVTTNATSSNSNMLSVFYRYSWGDETFLRKVPSKVMLLKHFKSILSTKGNFRYFFKTDDVDEGVVYEEISDDGDVVPLMGDKAFCLIRPSV